MTLWPKWTNSSRFAEALGAHATLKLFPDADHSFHVPARSGLTDAQVLAGVLDALVMWVAGLEKVGVV